MQKKTLRSSYMWRPLSALSPWESENWSHICPLSVSQVRSMGARTAEGETFVSTGNARLIAGAHVSTHRLREFLSGFAQPQSMHRIIPAAALFTQQSTNGAVVNALCRGRRRRRVGFGTWTASGRCNKQRRSSVFVHFSHPCSGEYKKFITFHQYFNNYLGARGIPTW